MNMQHSLIWEFMLYEFKLGHNTMEANKIICCIKDEGIVDPITVTRWFKKFFQELDDQASSDRPKTVDSAAMFQAIETDLASSIQRVSGEFGISHSSVSLQSRQKHLELLNCAPCYQNIAKPLLTLVITLYLISCLPVWLFIENFLY